MMILTNGCNDRVPVLQFIADYDSYDSVSRYQMSYCFMVYIFLLEEFRRVVIGITRRIRRIAASRSRMIIQLRSEIYDN